MAISVHKPASPDPSPSPSPSPLHSTSVPLLSAAVAAISSDTAVAASRSVSRIDFSPPLIAMVIVIASAFLIITYSRLISKHVTKPILNTFRHWRRRSHVASSAGDVESSFNHSNSNFFDPADGYQIFSPYGLDDSVIKTIPLSIYSVKLQHGCKKHSFVEIGKDCAVCLLEFEENDYVRTLPICSHNFHVDCIDIWLKSHANCPLCRARIFRPESPFVPLMAGRIRPSLDGILESILLEPLDEIQSENESENETLEQSISEITTARDGDSDDHQSTHQQDESFNFNRRNLLLKRSYSFGFERNFNFQSERLVLDSDTTSPWRYTTRRNTFWNKRLSPFGSLTKSRVFSFRSTRLTKSPFFMRRRGMFPFSESSRRSKSMASPAAGFSSSRLRCGDPEALLSPERYNRR